MSIHVAGPLLSTGLQFCARCGCVLTDYRFTMVLDGDPPLRGWAVGAHVEEIGGGPEKPTHWIVTTEPANCSKARK